MRDFEIIEKTVLYRGRVISLELDRVREPQGKTVQREIVRHGGAAVLMALLPDGKVVLVRQYRHAVQDFLWEVPAGGIDPGETPEETARRELVEEAGLYPHKLEKLTEFFPAPGFSTECMHLFLATELEERTPRPDADESLEIARFSPEEAWSLILGEKNRDAKTLLGLLLLRDRLDPRPR